MILKTKKLTQEQKDKLKYKPGTYIARHPRTEKGIPKMYRVKMVEGDKFLLENIKSLRDIVKDIDFIDGCEFISVSPLNENFDNE